MVNTRKTNLAGKGDEGPFWGDGNTLYLDYGGSYPDAFAPNQQTIYFKRAHLFYVNYTSIKLIKSGGHLQ